MAFITLQCSILRKSIHFHPSYLFINNVEANPIDFIIIKSSLTWDFALLEMVEWIVTMTTEQAKTCFDWLENWKHQSIGKKYQDICSQPHLPTTRQMFAYTNITVMSSDLNWYTGNNGQFMKAHPACMYTDTMYTNRLCYDKLYLRNLLWEQISKA